MYQEHFGLARPPFKITPDTSLFYAGSQRGAALDALAYAIDSGEGIIKVVGEVGSGKTMLCRMLELRLHDDIDIIYIANPSLSPDNILHVIAHELHLEVDRDMSKVDVMHRIQSHLLNKHAENQKVVLFVEEAQSMPIETLEEIRLLSNLETDENKLLQMVLFGQPELDEKLSLPQIRQLKERITHSFNLSPFPSDDTLHYLNFRLRAVGYRGPDIFNRKTAGVVKKYSDGLTRRINILADKSLIAAYSEGSHTVTPTHIKSAARDSEFSTKAKYNKFLLPAGLILLAIASAAGVYMGQMQQVHTHGEDNTGGYQQISLGESIRSEEVDNGQVNTQQPGVENLTSARLDERLQATKHWLAAVPDDHYSIQLFMARTVDADKIEAFLQDAPEMLDFTKIYIYETIVNSRLWYSVLYSDFASQDDAIDMLVQLPSSLKASDPYLRRISALKKDNVRFR